MKAKELLSQFFYTVISFLYINGDSEFSLNSDQDYISPQFPSGGQIFIKKPTPQQKNFSNSMSQKWPYIPGPGSNGNALIPMESSGLEIGDGHIGPLPIGAPAVGVPLSGPSIGVPAPGPAIEVPASGPGEPIAAGLAGDFSVGPVGKLSPASGGVISVSQSGKISGSQQISISQELSGEIQMSGGWKGGSWEGIAPQQPGAIKFAGEKPFPQIPNGGYLYGKPTNSAVPQPKPIPAPPTTLPIPGTLPELLKQPDIPADPIHGLPLNYLYSKIPLAPTVNGFIGPGMNAQINPLTSDIIIVIEASAEFGHIDATGKVIWNPLVVEFVTNFINQVQLGPNGARIGVVIVSFGIDDMISMTFDRKFLLESLNNLRPTFNGGCSGKGIGTANNLFFQYGRPTAVKRVIYITDGSPFCSYRSISSSKYARKCGIDIVNVIIGKNVPPPLDPTGVKSQWLLSGSVSLKLIWEQLMKRLVIKPVHGGWSMWSAWNPCSMQKSCNIGYQQRFRVCDNPQPMYGGVTCPGFPIETRMCYPNVCIDTTIGHWTRWADWTVCSVPCGIGSQTRSRNCVTLAGKPSPMCRGKYVEIRECMVKACPVNGGWSLWSKWGLCSAPCGVGLKMRARQCDRPAPKFGGKPCEGNSVEETTCNTGIPCPIDGGFGPWSEYSQCNVWCGMGEQTRSRKCDNPIPQFGGRPCQGNFVEKISCNTGVPCPIDGGWGKWGGYSLCNVPCGTGIQTRERLCNSPPPQYGGAQCKGMSIEEAICDTGKKCAIDGQWSHWSEYGPCSAVCGSSYAERQRVCNSPAPIYGGRDCVGNAFEKKKCVTGIPCPIDGGWGHWSVWSKCTVKCGTGLVFRRRECNSPPPQYGGALCVGMNMEEKLCHKKVSCPVNGQWSAWLGWSYCSASCGDGTRQRRRKCNNPAPLYGGLSCEGSPLHEEVCITGVPCPIAGGWSMWIVVEECNVKCGKGLGRRIRECSNPPPQYGGPDCVGPSSEVFECDTYTPCPINGGWGLWSLWTKCTVSCGMGLIQRTRTCDNPVPQYGGWPCEGPSVEETACKKITNCPVDGGWSFWSAWTLCSAKCGEGMSYRKRTCDSPAPMHDGRPCDGPAEEKMPCDSGFFCPIHGGWSAWSALSACSVTCGSGIMVKTRICNSPPPQHGGMPCEGFDRQELECKTGVHCPIHGKWGQWTKFSVCSVSCGIGTIERTRVCDSPAPAYGGQKCEGDSVQIRNCNTGIFCPIHGGWSFWSPFGPCSKSCGIGIKRRTRTCTNPIPQYGGNDCKGIFEEEKKCDTGKSCPVDGNWSQWGKWGKCSVVCGIGYQQRTRLCNNPLPLYGGGDCLGYPIEERECDTKIYCPIDGGWGKWSIYSKCSVTCGAGMQTRLRKCDSPMPQYGGRNCEGPDKDTIPCDTGINCPVHGQWTQWSSWEVCSVYCGKGMTQRFRDCSNPAPLYGGKPCPGKGFEEKTCDTGLHCPIHGGWSAWGKYSVCSATCGMGFSQRIRVCDNPVPMYGGDLCFGDNTQTKECDSGVPCPVDGGFSNWSKWSICSAKCGKGERTRTRLCDSPTPMYGGADCVGELIQTEICYAEVHCPIDGYWSDWSVWSLCSVTCGAGLKERDRVCNNPAPMYGGRPCQGDPVEIAPCYTGVSCAIDGGWSIWSLWTECSVTCAVGKKQRSRSCTNPAPQFGGRPCKGTDIQTQLCNTGVHCPQDGGWGPWFDFGKCQAKCGEGVYIRIRKCDNPPPMYGGRQCEGISEEALPCDSGVPCPIHGHWSAWDMWSVCSVTCGIGVQQRTRTCTNPAPKFGGDDCLGEFEQFRDCEPGKFCPVDGNWSPWSKYSLCSVSCGEGVHVRTRECTSPAPQYGGRYCEGPDTEKSPCFTDIMCPINGNWGFWGQYGKCSVTCGVGIQTRIRTCSNPAPQYGGELCFGNNAEDRPCDTKIYCPIHGGWTLWSKWGVCVADCGYGVQKRERFCTNPVPEYGGRKCEGPSVETQECVSDIPCPIDGNWGVWYEWSICSASCGYGFKERRRDCNNPEPLYGGKPCVGNDIETAECDSGTPCAIHGGWSKWSIWSKCIGPCGVGSKTKTRECNNPPPQFGGMDCVGAWKKTVDCDTGIFCPIDGQWSAWYEWGMCSAQCGKGTYTRIRKCDSPAPQYGGADCVGSSVEEGICDTFIPCPVHGGWSFWSVWSACSETCGIGTKFRTRQCNNPSPLYGGYQCKGPAKEVIDCDSGAFCPVHGNWGKWSEYTVCEGKCGMGFKHRFRKCDSPAPQYGGMPCEGGDQETVECKIGIPCVIDGGWTFWSVWGVCMGKCGMGIRERTRTCTNPPPQYGGADCVGPDIETEKCKTKIPCPIDGNWGMWLEWSMCMGQCGKGMATRVRYCDSPKPQYGGFKCAGPSEERMDCDTGIPCSIDGGWTFWSKWSACLGPCGVGMKKRSRECTNPVPQFGGKPCKGPAEDVMECDTFIPCAVDGNWSPWSDYSYCSVTCGFGTRTRERICNNPPPQYGGRLCEGKSKESIGCDMGIACAVDGNWNSWYEWSICSVTCGVGERERRRECDNPPPSYGGRDCPGKGYEISTCDTKIFCPVHGNWALWGAWGHCLGYCGYGKQTRERTCSDPEPMYGGEPCFGDAKEKRECDTGVPCAIDGNWGPWGKFSKCSVECGVGYMVRTRLCDSPPPQYGGLGCYGRSKDKVKCDTLKPCAIHGGWSFWGAWSICSASCGYGLRSRIRTCTNPSPLYGGKLCPGPSEQINECDSGIKCPIHGYWSLWSEWSFCSAKCGYGTRKRTRECSKPSYGGMPCEGKAFEIQDCKADIPCPIHGHWSAWGVFSKCSVTCGFGVKIRLRYCDNPAPQYGGKDCVGNAKDVIECDSGFACPIDGGWSAWGQYSYCSATCGEGFKTRERFCNSPPPQFGGLDCYGPSLEKIPCDKLTPCPIDGGFSFWSAWSACSATCGFGFKMRSRTCTNPKPMYGGKPCDGPLEEFLDCKAGMLCPIDGFWSSWSNWDKCDAVCGKGRQIRFRTCTNPKPQHGGRLCFGSPEEWRECTAAISCPIDGRWSYWSKWSFCEGECDMGVQFRTRTCTEPAPKFGGAFCEGKPKESRPCDTGVPCKVVIDGNWSAWGFWSKCSASCGDGLQERLRYCDNPAPMNGGLDCVGNAKEVRTCYADMKCAIHGGWSIWTIWSKCSVSCGKGIQTRIRYCDNPAPMYGGRGCKGYAEERITCYSDIKCGIDGGWSIWSIWSKCSATCGEGIQTRLRYCDNPAPMYGGRDCQGYAEETLICYADKKCGIDGGWSVWSIWSKCSASCGEGIKTRIRYCDNPAPMYGGRNCQGYAEERIKCYADIKCGIDGGWSIWSIWSKCSASCGEGFQTRVRYCNNPSPMYGGRDCQGYAEERITCSAASKCSINGGWSWWSKWSACTTTCGEGMRERQRFCDNPPPQYGGLLCSGPNIERAPCLDNPKCPDYGVWSEWLGWQRCDCNTGLQQRVRICKGVKGCVGKARMDKSCDPIYLINNCEQGEWQMWSVWSSCSGSCGQGVMERTRDCINIKTGAISTACKGLHTELKPCPLRPCLTAEWELWSKWSACSQTCGQGVKERTRMCIDTMTGEPTKGCIGLNTEIITCEVLPCPTRGINCSTECKWDNGIGYAVYPGDCSMFVQCDSLYGHPLIQQCPWGLLWSLDVLQCTFPHMSECDKCAKIKPGQKRSYYITCRSYWTCTNGRAIPHCCKRGYRFDHKLKDCVLDAAGTCNDDCPPVEKTYKSKCNFRTSALGPTWYEEKINNEWITRPCGDGTEYLHEMCECIYKGSDGTLPAMPECLPDLHLTFNSLQSDLQRNDGIHVENVKYLGDGTAYFDGTAVINSNIFSNAEWGRNVYVYIRFKPEGSGRRQGLVHNSGCGPSDIGPSVFIGLDRVAGGMDMKFSAVPQQPDLKYEFVNITTPENKMLDAWFRFGNNQFSAEVNGITAVLDLPGKSVDRRHGALNIGGNLCRIGNEAFGGFIGIIDEVKIYKCKPPI